jgi:hypothetical protein
MAANTTSPRVIATVTPATANQSVRWSSSNENVATVDQNGIIRARRQGTTTITATSWVDESEFDDFELTVRNPVTVRFHGNNSTHGARPPNQTRLAGTGFPLPERNRLSRAGYVFDGWQCMVSNQNFAAGANMNLSSNASGTWDMQARWIHATHPRFNGRFEPLAWPGTSITVRFDSSVDAFWRTNMERGIEAWNSSATPINFSVNENSNNVVSVVRDTESIFGWIHYNEQSGGRLLQFDIEMNETYITNMANANNHEIRNYITSTFVHELGHTAGLADNPIDAIHLNGSIMNTQDRRNRNTLLAPTAFDVESINMIH